MLYENLRELHYITCYESLPSILEHGLLSHNRARGVPHESIADPGVQERRDLKRVAGRPLHDYVNLYYWARNAMLYRCYRAEQRRNLVVLSIHKRVIHIPGTVVTDRNAAKDFSRAQPASPDGLAIVDDSLTFVERWTDPDYLEYLRRKAAGQAELLVPDRVAPEHVTGAYLPSRRACADLYRDVPDLPSMPWPRLFFLGSAGRGWRYEVPQ